MSALLIVHCVHISPNFCSFFRVPAFHFTVSFLYPWFIMFSFKVLHGFLSGYKSHLCPNTLGPSWCIFKTICGHVDLRLQSSFTLIQIWKCHSKIIQQNDCAINCNVLQSGWHISYTDFKGKKVIFGGTLFYVLYNSNQFPSVIC